MRKGYTYQGYRHPRPYSSPVRNRRASDNPTVMDWVLTILTVGAIAILVA